jgi:hypothetical protein
MAQPFDREWSGTTDANGNLTVTLTPLAAYDSALVIAGQAQGNPIWAIFKNGNFLLPGAGPQMAVGPVYFKAKEALTITVSGGSPNSSVAGSIWGTQSTLQNGTDLPVLHPQTSGSLPVFNSTVRLPLTGLQAGTIPGLNQIGLIAQVGGGNVGKFTFLLSPGMEVVTLWMAAAVQQSILLRLDGIASQFVYFFSSANAAATGGAGSAAAPPRIPVDPAFETALQLTVDNSGNASTVLVYVTGGPNPDKVIQANLAVQNVPLTTIGGALLITSHALPYDWQQSGSFNNAAATLTAATGGTGKKAVMGGYVCRVANNAATSFSADLQFVDGAATQVWRDGVSIPAVSGSQDRAIVAGLAAAGGTNQSLTMKLLTNPGAAIFVDMSFGGWYV